MKKQPQITPRHSSIRPFYRGYKIVDKTGSIGGEALFTPSKVRTGSSNPMWESQIKRLIDASTSYYCKYGPFIPATTGPLIADQPVNWKWIDTEWIVDRYGSWTTTMTGYPHRDHLIAFSSEGKSFSTETNAALSRGKLAFLDKLRETESSFSSLTFIGELKETVGMIRHPLKGILKSTRKYRDKVLRLKRVRERFTRRFGRSSNELVRRKLALMLNRTNALMENAYLQWTYGVSPLMGDIDGIMEAVQRLSDKQRDVVRLSVTVPVQLPVTSYSVVSVLSGPGRVVFQTFVQEVPVLKVRFKGAVKVSVDPPDSVERLRSLSNFDLSQVVPTFYELLPFSFVADYFSTIGDVVNGVFTSTRNLVYATQSTSVEASRLCIVVGLPSRWGVPTSWPLIPAAGLAEYRTLNRVKANLAVSYRDLRLTIPNMDQIRNLSVLGSSLVRSFRER